ncbi:hypothetical protein OH77DRAFT_1326219 [Trametes cingulata]|nr:hypothetical protein OH77DRAFT_1326219 [Trametes cingulata]
MAHCTITATTTRHPSTVSPAGHYRRVSRSLDDLRWVRPPAQAVAENSASLLTDGRDSVVEGYAIRLLPRVALVTPRGVHWMEIAHQARRAGRRALIQSLQKLPEDIGELLTNYYCAAACYELKIACCHVMNGASSRRKHPVYCVIASQEEHAWQTRGEAQRDAARVMP